MMNILYTSPVVEFVTVGAEFCAFLEQSEGRERTTFVETLQKLLPVLYVKALLLPSVEGGAEYGAESHVTEEDYEWLRATLARVMGDADSYEDLIYDEDMQTDDTRWQSVSENLADIYQPVRDFVETYRRGVDENIEEALWSLNDSFELFWGGNLVDVLRRLHRIRYMINNS